jgi:uncharacterized membrane protein
MARELELSGTSLAGVLVILGIALPLCFYPVLGGDLVQNSSAYQSNLVLNVYINDAGKALVTGYADRIDGLSFLKTSQYRYDNDSKQLYALTDSLTFKTGNDWEAKLSSQGNYSEYHSTFYLPTTVVLSGINSSQGLEYQVSASNESFMVEIHGYDINDPSVSVKYQLPLLNSPPGSAPGAAEFQILAAAFLILILASSAAAVWLKRRKAPGLRRDIKGASSPAPSPAAPQEGLRADAQFGDEVAGGSAYGAEYVSVDAPASSEPEASIAGNIAVNSTDDTDNAISSPDQKQIESEFSEDDLESATAESDFDAGASESVGSEDLFPQADLSEQDSQSLKGKEEKPVAESTGIEITSEMAAVMETLTSRERTVLNALIGRKGRMTQADIRYETRIPKSSLTGILLSLERRKLIIKKEWGRTNIIELSEWFLSKKERS